MAGAGGPHSASSPCNLSRSLDRTLAEAQATCELKLSGRKLKEYPKGAAKYNLSDTVIADLSKNRFSEVPAEVTTYTSLEHLSLYQNVIKSLPDSLSALHSLTHLILSRNQLSVVPGCVCSLAGLRVLDVSGNRLVSLPEELGHLHSLMDLDASYNQLAHLPPALMELDALRRLNLRRNLLQTLPSEVCFLRLVILDLSGNRLSVLPTELRFMSSLLTLSLHSNPLHHPPANLCTRGRVHIFKWLELAAAKEDKKRGALTSEAEFRKLHLRKPSSSCTDFRFMNGLIEARHSKRSTMDSGYSTCDSVDQRWSRESQESLESEDPRKLAVRAAALTKEQRQERGRGPTHRLTINGIPNGELSPAPHIVSGAGLNGGVNGGGAVELGTSGPSTPSTLSPGDTFNLEDEFNKALKLRQDYENVFPGEQLAPGSEGQREYVEAKLQKRAMDSSSVYRRAGGGGGEPDVLPTTVSHHLSQHPRTAPSTTLSKTCNGSRVSPSKGSPSSSSPDVSFDSMDGCPYPSSTYNPAHSSSPYTSQTHMATSSSHTTTNAYTSSHHHTGPPQSNLHSASHHPSIPSQSSSHLTSTTRGNGNAIPKAPLATAAPATATTIKTRKRSGGGRTFDPDANPAHLSFTYRRELEKQQHEKQLVEKLRNIIETRLKVSLPADISAALMDGVVLCHLANHVRPRSVSSIHVPSPAVPKLTIAKCRLNVENFLEACRKIGVEDGSVCACEDIVTQFNLERVLTTVRYLVDPSESPLVTNGSVTVASVDTQKEPWTECREEPASRQDQPLLSHSLLCIFLATLVLLYWYPPPND